jgi:hypothetical protein
LLIGAPRPFYACQAFLCIPAHKLTFMLVRPFYTKQRTSCSKSCLLLWKKKNDLSRNDSFLGDSLSGLSFCSRQKARCDLLDLPVLFFARASTVVDLRAARIQWGAQLRKNRQRHDLPWDDGEVITLPFNARTHSNQANLLPGGANW